MRWKTSSELKSEPWFPFSRMHLRMVDGLRKANKRDYSGTCCQEEQGDPEQRERAETYHCFQYSTICSVGFVWAAETNEWLVLFRDTFVNKYVWREWETKVTLLCRCCYSSVANRSGHLSSGWQFEWKIGFL